MADNPDSDSAPLLAALKKSRPSSLRVVLLDGEQKDIGIPGKRKKWSQVLSMLGRLSWVQLECLDAKGRTIDIVENDEAAEELESLEGYGGQVHQLTALMLKAQDVALRRDGERAAAQNSMVLQLCQLLMSRLNALEKGFGANLRMMQKYARAATEGGDEEEDGLMSGPLMEALAPHLLARLLKAVGGGAVEIPEAPGAGNSEPEKA